MKHLLLLLYSCLYAAIFSAAQETKLMLPLGHTYPVISAQFSPDGKKIVTASSDNTAKIWETASGALLADLKGHTARINSAAFSADGKKIVTSSNDTTAKIWEVSTGRMLLDLKKHTAVVLAARFSPDGKKIATASNDKTAMIWDAETGAPLTSCNGHKGVVWSVQFSADGKKLLTASYDYTAKVWDVITGKMLADLKAVFNNTRSAQFSPDTKKIITANDNTIKIWDVLSGAVLSEIKGHSNNISAAQFSPDGRKILVTASDSMVEILDAATGAQLVNLKDTIKVRYAGFSADGKKIITFPWQGNAPANNTASLWEAATGKLLVTLKGHSNYINAAQFSADGKKIVTASNDNSARLWDAVTGELLADLTGHAARVNSAQFIQAGRKIITATNDNAIKIWNLATGSLLYNLKGQAASFDGGQLSTDGKKIALAAGGDSNDRRLNIHPFDVLVWDLSTGTVLADLKGHTDEISSAQFSADGKKIVTAAADSTVKIWNAVTGAFLTELKRKIPETRYAGFSPDGKKVITFSWEAAVQVWDAATGNFLFGLKGHSGFIMSVQFSPDGKKMLTASNDSTAKIWDFDTGKMLGDLKEHTGRVNSAVFSNDGKKIVTASFDHSAKTWDAATGKLLADLKKHSQDVGSAVFSPDDSNIITAAYDNTVKIWDAATGGLLQDIALGPNTYLEDIHFSGNQLMATSDNELKLFNYKTGQLQLSLVMIDSNDWTVLHPSGLFDASAGGMEKMYWVKQGEVINLRQLKDRYWQPGLWGKVMEGETLRSVAGMSTLKMQPEVELGEIKDHVLTIRLKKREGGYGKVSIAVNNKELIQDARPRGFDTAQHAQTITINLKNNPDLKEHMAGISQNKVTVKVQSADGFVSSGGVEIIDVNDLSVAHKKPAFYAIICGTGEFSNPKMNLRYPVVDADAITKAITLGAENLFGKDSTHVYKLCSPGSLSTSKKNIQQQFEAIKAKASAEDIVLVYLSGHGIVYGGEKGDFYYLTTDYSGSSAESIADPALRQTQAISTEEFTQWLNAIPALKQVMIIDACGSGKAVDNLMAKRDIEPSQLKAIDRMRDRTGLYIISGCAADAVSYESNRYGQGLLTYSVLQAIKGNALREHKFVDILTLLNFSREEVPKMAADIGGIQQPQLLLPKSGSFDIGIIKEEDKFLIPLASIKPVYLRSTLLEETKKRDVLKISAALNEKLNEMAAVGEGKNAIIYIDADDYPNACSISGAYTMNGEKIAFTGSLLCGTKEKSIKIAETDKKLLVEQLTGVALQGMQ